MNLQKLKVSIKKHVDLVVLNKRITKNYLNFFPRSLERIACFLTVFGPEYYGVNLIITNNILE